MLVHLWRAIGLVPARRRPARRHAARRSAPSFRPRAEGLEDRRLLAAGVLDPSFVGQGIAIYPLPTTVNGLVASGTAVAGDGKIVVAANAGDQHLVVQRFNANGSRDTSFGTGGTASTPVASLDAFSQVGVTVQADGKIIVAGSTGTPAGNTDFAPPGLVLVRYTPGGTLDPTFGTGGTALTAGPTSETRAVTLQPDGKIVVTGRHNTSYDAVRFNPDGTLDATFGSGGTASVPDPDGLIPFTDEVAVQPDGKIVLAGGAGGFGGGSQFVLVRLTPSGSPDPTFGGDGVAKAGAGPFNTTTGLALQDDGRIVLTGFVNGVGTTSPNIWAVGRFNGDGTPDPGFGTNGFVTQTFGDAAAGVAATASDVSAQPDGKLVVVGSARVGSGSAFALARYNPDGSLDPAFGSGGRVTTAVGGFDAAQGVDLVGNGIVTSGTADSSSLALLRFVNDVFVAPSTPQFPPLAGGEEVFVTGADAGGGPDVKLFDAAGGTLLGSFFAYDPAFGGGVRVAVGDVSGDRVPDVITAPGPGGGPDVHVYDGKTGLLLRKFYAFGQDFFGGLYVAAGDVNADGFSDIVVGADAGGGANVAIFDGKTTATGQPIAFLVNFFPYGQAFTGGVRVAAGDVNADSHADLICGAGPGGGPNVSIISGADGKTLLGSFFPYDMRFTGGLYMAAGDVDGDGHADIITGVGPGGGPNVAVISGATFQAFSSFFPYDVAFVGGVRVGAVDRNGDGQADVLCVPGPGGGPDVRTVNALAGTQLDDFFAYDPHFAAGLFVAGSGL